MATLTDIALELGISKSTVSKALNGAGDVSEAMRRSVLEKAVELGYTRISRSSKQPRIAVFIMNMDYEKPADFGYDIVVGFRKLAEPAGFRVDIIPLTRELQIDMRYDQYMILNNYRGGLFLGLSLLDPWLKEFETCKTPTVLYDNRVTGNPNVTYVGVDNQEGMDYGVAYLKSLGHKKIGYLSSALDAYVYQQRYQAFFRALRANGLPDDPMLSGSSYHVSVCLAENLPRLLKEGCTAFICSHDLMAHSAVIHCQELGLRVPEDVSILGFDDGPLCLFSSPQLSSIRQNRTEMGRSAFCALSSQLNRVPLSTMMLHAELICRYSCAPAPKKGYN